MDPDELTAKVSARRALQCRRQESQRTTGPNLATTVPARHRGSQHRRETALHPAERPSDRNFIAAPVAFDRIYIQVRTT